jgi:hypothetical protein
MRARRHAAARSPGTDFQAAGGTREHRQQTRHTTIHTIQRAQRLVDLAALLSLDLATLAAEGGRAQHAKAALHLRDATYSAWLAAESLCEEVVS